MKIIKFSKILISVSFIILTNISLAIDPITWAKDTKKRVLKTINGKTKKAKKEFANLKELTGQKIKSCSEISKISNSWIEEKSGIKKAKEKLIYIKNTRNNINNKLNQILKNIDEAQKESNIEKRLKYAELKRKQKSIEFSLKEIEEQLDLAENELKEAEKKAGNIINILVNIKRICGK